ncbi:MAG: A24 family peptidase [Janthinobacterium lividum]
MSLLTGFATFASIAILLYAAASDILVRSVPNRVSVAIAGIGLSVDLARGDAMSGLIVATLVFASTVLLWRLGAMGGADAKLIPAVTMLLPPSHAPELLVCVAFSGGLLSAFYLALRHLPPLVQRRSSVAVLRRLRIEQSRARRADALPYVVAISAGTFIALAKG